jgi:hypothetical protein
MKKWEYKVVCLQGSDQANNYKCDLLTTWGVMGWELVAVIPPGPARWPLAYFKRESPDEIIKIPSLEQPENIG